MQIILYLYQIRINKGEIISLFVDPKIEYNSENLYAPSDDTYLLIDYFKRKITKKFFDGISLSEINKILDLGTGTGILAIFIQLIAIKLSFYKIKIYASDILKDAIYCAKYNERLNNINQRIIFIHSNLFRSFPEELKYKFNIIIFNPPYLPSSNLIINEQTKINIDYSWNGGSKGYEILIDFLKTAKMYLNCHKMHYIYFISSSRTDLNELNIMINNLGYQNEVVDKKHIFFEDILLNRAKLV